MPHRPVLSFGTSSAGPGMGQAAAIPLLVLWDGFPRAKGSLDSSPSPDFPSLPRMHRAGRKDSRDAPSVTPQPGIRKKHTLAPQEVTLAAQRAARSSEEFWLIWGLLTGFRCPIFRMGCGTGGLMGGSPALGRCCKGDVILALWRNPCASVYP